jgi:hypothetical protein
VELHGLPAKDQRRKSLAAELHKTAEERGPQWLAAVVGKPGEEISPKFRRGGVEGIEFTSLSPFWKVASELFRLFPIHEMYFWWQYQEGLNERSLPRLAEMPELARLRKLRLANYGTAAPTEAWRTFFQSEHLAGLEFLGADACEFTDADAEALAESSSLAGLTVLSLADNRMSIRGVWALLRSPHLVNLTRLALGYDSDFEDADPDEYQALLDELASRFPDHNPLEEFIDE